MLHEILLSLSGQPSPLFNSQSEADVISEDAFPLVSPPEKALLASLARLSRLHTELRAHTALISSSHPSVICRAVSTAISSRHLGDFQRKILEVEKAILVEDSGYVGGYGIVPLSTIVGEFSPWTRRLEWLWETVRLIWPIDSRNQDQLCTGVALIDHLRAESQTGYVDLKEMALHLVAIAETAWMRQLSTWLLYGNLPILGESDFFIQRDKASEGDQPFTATQFVVHPKLLPQFVTAHTASSILFIGKTLNLIRAKRSAPAASPSASLSTTPVTLHVEHIEHLASLKSPISASKLSSAVNIIRYSLSQSTLSKLFPLQKILETLSVLHDFLLLRRGEFAAALVSHADSRIQDRYRKHEHSVTTHNPAEGLGGLSIKEGDVVTTLSQTLSELYSLQTEEDPADDELDLAKDLLRLSIKQNMDDKTTQSPGMAEVETGTGISDVAFDDLLFPTPTCLSVQVRPPLDLFLSASDISVYSKIHSYILGIRRAQMHLGDLWKHTFLRRVHPSPWGPPRSSTPYGQSRLKLGRQRDSARTRQMRPIWATSSASLFVLSEIGSYFQGEVLNGSWQHFREWIGGGSPTTGSRPGTASSSTGKRLENLQRIDNPTDSGFGDAGQTIQRHDPETLTAAHRRYLFALVESLFLTDIPFTKALRSFLTSVEHFIALVVRLESIQRNMDLETDEGVIDALVDYAGEEREIWQALGAARASVEAGIKDAVARLRDIDDSRSGEGRQMLDLVKDSRENGSFFPVNGSATEPGLCHYVPRKAAGVDHLLMKLDFGNANGGMVAAAGAFGGMA
ncbi:putative gamma-tubulin complex component GCP4 [Aspergillus ibericus CBS 121593]|uniref:Spindle pole body component n=1 Tax=Aspergillus ibericus CBS 121593 TaxID=1448316 RepID=A0A395HCN1_9EURO|nr:Spc98 family protein [Aspergillus ibericus CBS 121593]RAL04718.1 Spc98 family protein [Aspergillus ibericus CBS 121593]